MSLPNEVLVAAAARGDEAGVADAVARGAHVDVRDQRPSALGMTPLMHAAAAGSTAAVRVLLAGGADVNAVIAHPKLSRDDLEGELFATLPEALQRGPTALHEAVRGGHHEVARLLLEAGAKVEVRDPLRATPLLRAAQRADGAMVALLADAGATAAVRTSELGTPLHAVLSATERLPRIPKSAYKGRMTLGNHFVGDEHLLDVVLPEERTLPIVERLLAAGADPTARHWERNVEDLARVHWLKRIQAVLHGAVAQRSNAPKLSQPATPRKPRAQSPRQRVHEMRRQLERMALPEPVPPDLGARRDDEAFQHALADLAGLCNGTPQLMPWGAYEVPVAVHAQPAVQIAEVHAAFLQRGAVVVEAELWTDSSLRRVAIYPTADVYEAIVARGPSGAEPGQRLQHIVHVLRELEKEQPFRVLGISKDSIRLEFLSALQDPQSVAERLHAICDDLMQNYDSLPHLVEGLTKHGGITLWWD